MVMLIGKSESKKIVSKAKKNNVALPSVTDPPQKMK